MENNKNFEIECNAIAQLFPGTDIDIVKAAWKSFKGKPIPKGQTAVFWFTQCMLVEAVDHTLLKEN